MPVEIRRIEFTEIELRSALSLYQAKTEGGQPTEGRVTGVKVMGGEEFNVVAKVSSPTNGDLMRKVFDHPMMVAVMVLFSKQAGIPLPRDGRKVMAPTQFGGVSMTIRYEHNVCEALTPRVDAAALNNPKPNVAAVGHA